MDHAIFYPKDAATTIKPYFLHISAYQPKKNFDRILAAYQKLPEDKPMLLAVIPGYHHKTEIPGVEIIKRSLTHQELSELYRNAYAFIFPSLHETFGHPIMEAMACGCPVMTSNTTSCAEVAGHAALLVNPRSVEEIAAAMGKLLFNYSLCQSLRSKGIERAMQFTWHKCAMEHLAVFNEIKSL